MNNIIQYTFTLSLEYEYYCSKWIKMEIVDKINYLLKEKHLLKKDFAHMLQSLEPKLKSTGNIPNTQTIYGYLNGKRELKVELIPYIAEVLNVQEQELFTFDIEYAMEYNIRYSKEAREILELFSHAPKSLRLDIKDLLLSVKESYQEKLKDIKVDT